MQKNEVICVPILPFGMVNAYIVKGKAGCLIVDTGLPGSEKKFEKILKENHLSFKDIKLIVVTHAHVDHAGSAEGIRKLSGAPVVAHAGDLPYFNQEKKMSFCATGWFGRFFLKTGLILQPFTGFKPDILLSGKEVLKLDQFGFDGTVKSTPGHTAGSISVELSNQEVLVGDLLASGILLGGLVMTNRPQRPPFEDDPASVAQELESLCLCGFNNFYMGHGGPLTQKEVKIHLAKLKNIVSKPNNI